MNDNRDIEAIRESFKPEKVKFLFVGESPPKNSAFFYEKDKICNLTTYTKQAFQQVFKDSPGNNCEFLDYFKSRECYLDDLCHEPVDQLPQGSERNKRRRDSVEGLVERIKDINPRNVVIIGIGIKDYVQQAIEKSECTPNVFVLPFAGQGHQVKYLKELKDIIRNHIPSPVITPEGATEV